MRPMAPEWILDFFGGGPEIGTCVSRDRNVVMQCARSQNQTYHLGQLVQCRSDQGAWKDGAVTSISPLKVQVFADWLLTRAAVESLQIVGVPGNMLARKCENVRAFHLGDKVRCHDGHGEWKDGVITFLYPLSMKTTSSSWNLIPFRNRVWDWFSSTRCYDAEVSPEAMEAIAEADRLAREAAREAASKASAQEGAEAEL